MKKRLGDNLSATRDEKREYDRVYCELVAQYGVRRRPVDVDFRQIVPMHSGIDRATHLLHPYPAKLLVNIPYFFLNCGAFCDGAKSVADPFCGSGTVLLEGIISGKNAYGTDANPLARLIATAKVTPISEPGIHKALKSIKAVFPSQSASVSITVLDINRWYPPRIVADLARLKHAIDAVTPLAVRTFLLACFSVVVRRLSYADPRLSVPVRLSLDRYREGHPLHASALARIQRVEGASVLDEFEQIVQSNAKRIVTLNSVGGTTGARVIGDDARAIDKALISVGAPDQKVDLIIASPPYVGAQKYIRASSLSLCWLGLCNDELRPLERKNIGREHYSKEEYAVPLDCAVESATNLLEQIRVVNPLRGHIAAQYLNEMQYAIQSAHNALNSGGKLVLVIGNNTICGFPFDTKHYIHELCQKQGFTTELVLCDVIKSRGLMTKRNRTASMISVEWILVLRK